MSDFFQNMFNQNNGPNRKPDNHADETIDFRPKNPKKLGKRIALGVIAVVAAVLVVTSFYNVGEQEQAVVTQFGKVVATHTAGLYFKIPFIQQVTKVDTTTHGLAIGYDETGTVDQATIDAESVMITKDFNFVDVDFYLEYRVSDPVKYIYNSDDTNEILKNITQACIRSTIVNYDVDSVITTEKGQIQSDIKEKLIEQVTNRDIGIQIVNISMQDAVPPTEEIIQAFKAVETAKQGKETALNNANKYRNEQIPAAEALADQIVKNAEAEKESRIAEAEGQVARFNKMFDEYEKYPLITKKRLFYETLEDVLPQLKIIISDGGTQTMLPLEDFFSLDVTNAQTAPATSYTPPASEPQQTTEEEETTDEE